jgi:hypothetical protein
MTYAITITGQTVDTDPEARASAERELLEHLVEATDAAGHQVGAFSFSGETMTAATLDQAKALLGLE